MVFPGGGVVWPQLHYYSRRHCHILKKDHTSIYLLENLARQIDRLYIIYRVFPSVCHSILVHISLQYISSLIFRRTYSSGVANNGTWSRLSISKCFLAVGATLRNRSNPRRRTLGGKKLRHSAYTIPLYAIDWPSFALG